MDPQFLFLFIPLNLAIAFLSVFVMGEFHFREKKRLLSKTLINFFCAPFRFPIHIIVRLLLLFDIDVPVDYGCFDNDNFVSTLLYSLTLADFEPSWGDYPSRDTNHTKGTRSQIKTMKYLKKHPENPYNYLASNAPSPSTGQGQVCGFPQVLNYAFKTAKFHSCYYHEYGNKVNIDFKPMSEGNTIVFRINLDHVIRKPFNNEYDYNSFESGLQIRIDSAKNSIRNDMKTFAERNTVTVDVSIRFEKGAWNL